MPITLHQCRFYLDIKGKLKPREIDQICDITLEALTKSAIVPAEKIGDIKAISSKIHCYDAKKGKKLKSTRLDKSFHIHAEIMANAVKMEILMERTVHILKADLIAAGFKIKQGWGETILATKAEMED